MLNFGNNTKTCACQIIVKTIESPNFQVLAIEFVDNPSVMSNTDMLSRLLLLLHMILLGFLECLTLKVNINYLVKIYKLSAALRDLSSPFVVHIREINLYVTN